MGSHNKQKVYALVDCNSFFCSCERLFRPEIRNKPVGVLSNNDGCFVSRTPELKALGVKMGDPYFKVRRLCESHNVHVFSSNFSLYTNISDRVMNVLARFAPSLEIYSVDEAFLDLTGMDEDLVAYGHRIRETVLQWTGIPVSIGIAPSKTLAKIANHIGKKSEKANGVVCLLDERLQDVALKRVSIEDVWGIGRKNSVKLRTLGIKTAYDFKAFKNIKVIQRTLTKLGRMTQDELRGITCYELEECRPKKKEILCSRTFSGSVVDLKSLRESVANYVTNASEKMRAQRSLCATIEVYCHSDPHKLNEVPYYGKDKVKLLGPTSDTRKIIKYAWSALDDLFKMGVCFKKAGVKLGDFSDDEVIQQSLFEELDDPRSAKLMKIVDEINRREGSGMIRSMACGVDNDSWKMRREKLSRRYVTGWAQLPKCS
ncbi:MULTISPECIES: Y-family DNA polymerase [Halobacteriovorax]|uniref:Y-family DNA polymerase n=1 Tax=Halobacteriovorax vibrionivorans TaxID=2152716 RepID=A0ABY0IJV3_9BACT|nr:MULTISPECIES: Y-family DNA polymerase [Halobacteriovorax]AYF45698.1 ImpB/MucB/SamB family protein [Halobacteriovorax sp. BALOs_7]RZF22760.1 Y-family DNA polymerase [Halobacteriovorax vibrionivorans]TGD46196.1 Y-family DNA polymerase [Halobacteriovorax sp. Y22]